MNIQHPQHFCRVLAEIGPCTQVLRLFPQALCLFLFSWNTVISVQLMYIPLTTCSILPSFFHLISLVFPFRTFYLCAKTGVEADEWIKILRWKLVSYTSFLDGCLVLGNSNGDDSRHISVERVRVSPRITGMSTCRLVQ